MKKSLKVISMLITSALLSTALAGCSSASSSASSSSATSSATPAADKPVSIRVATTFTGADSWTATWQQAIKDFNAKYPNITVTDEATPAAGDAFKTKINTDFASGNEPDVTYGFNGETGKPLVDSGKLITWEDELAKDPTWAANFNKAQLESVKYNGKLYALPYIGFVEGMFVNPDVFKSAGLEVPKTYADIVKDIPALRAKEITPIVCSFAEEPHYLIETFLLSMGGVDGHKTQFDASWAPALNLIKDLYEKKAFTEDALTIKQASCAQLFSDKKAAMFISGSWSGGGFKDKDNTTLIPLPLVTGGKDDGKGIIGGAGTGWYVVDKLNKDKNGAAMKFVKYMTTPEVLAKFIAVGGVPMMNVSTGGLNKLSQSYGDFTKNASSMSSPVGDQMSQEAFTALWKGLSYIVTGKKTADQVLTEAKALVKK